MAIALGIGSVTLQAVIAINERTGCDCLRRAGKRVRA
jgi:hypothetical protein